MAIESFSIQNLKTCFQWSVSDESNVYPFEDETKAKKMEFRAKKEGCFSYLTGEQYQQLQQCFSTFFQERSEII